MQSFIVLGIVPGTNFELTFNFWLYAAMLLLSLRFLQYAKRHRTDLHALSMAQQLAHFIRQYQFQVPA